MTPARVGVVTPYHLEDINTLARCQESVINQSFPSVVHMMVADGKPRSDREMFPGIEHMILPSCHGDAGATPRALGAISLFSRGFDAVAFLDADNTFRDDHVALMVDAMEAHGADVVTATRNICTVDGEAMYVDDIESNGEDFCDTNCLFIGKSCLHLLTYWVTSPSMRLWSDRQFWSAIKQSGAKRTHCKNPSVNYHSKWAWHYQQAGRNPPDDSVWINTLNGQLVHTKHKEARGDTK